MGSLVVGFVTAIGGGTIRDIMIGRFPVGWLHNRSYILAVVVGLIVAYLLKDHILKYKKSMFLFDTLGIGVFTILGIDVALSYDLNPEICIVMGVISACFGGVIRDVLTNEVPLIFRKEIYASACFAGGLIYLLLEHISTFHQVNIISAMIVIMLIRYASIKYGWSLHLKRK